MSFRWVLIVLSGFLCSSALPSFSACANCSMLPPQITDLLQQAQYQITRAQNLKKNIQQYQLMLENYKSLPDHVKQKALEDLKNLANIVATGRAVAYSSEQVSDDYQREHRTYKEYQKIKRGNQGQRDHQAFSQHYQDWSEVNHDSIRGALRAANLQASQFDRETSALKKIEEQIESASGTKQLLQAGSSIAAIQVEQLTKLRQLQMAQIQLQSAQAGSAIDRQAEEDADLQRALRPNQELNPNRSGGLDWNTSIRDN